MNHATEAVPTLRLADMPATPPKVLERLLGRVIAGGWLAADLDPELDAARERHHELLRVAAGAADALRAERRSWEEQDREHAERLREAVRRGRPEPPDERASPAERRAQEAGL